MYGEPQDRADFSDGGVLVVAPDQVVEAAGKATEQLLERGVLGAMVVILLAVCLALYWRIGKEIDKREAMGEKRVEDQRLAADRYHGVVAENVKTLEALAEASEQAKERLERVERAVDLLVSKKGRG